MGINTYKPTKLAVFSFVFFLFNFSSETPQAKDSREKTTSLNTLNSVESQHPISYSVKQPSLVLFNENASDRLSLFAKEVHANSNEGSVFVLPRVEFTLGDFAYVSESDRAVTDYRPAKDVAISLSGSVKLIGYSSDATFLSTKSDLLAIDLINEKITGAGSVEFLIETFRHNGDYFSIEPDGIFRLHGEDNSRITGELNLRTQ